MRRHPADDDPGFRTLSRKEARFAHEFCYDCRARTAALRAGYPVAEAAEAALILMADEAILDRIRQIQDACLARIPVSTDELLHQLECIATFDPRKLFDAAGASLGVTELDDDTAAAIASIDVEAIYDGRAANRSKIGELRKWKVESKRGAIETLLKQRGVLKEKVEHCFNLDALTDEELLQLERIQLKLAGSPGDSD